MRRRILVVLSMILVVAISISVAVGVHSSETQKVNGNVTETQTTKPVTTKPETTLPPQPEKLVAFTFDDGPSKNTQYLIDEMNKRGMKATFFMLGSNAEKYPEVIQYMYKSGNQLGSHTYDHENISKIDNEEFVWQISKTDNAIFNAVGQNASVFRPPYGAYNSEKIAMTDKPIVLWSVDTNDWRHKNDPNGAQFVCDSIMSSVKDGSIVLMHDLYTTSVQGALMAADQLIAQGYKFVTVNEILSRDGQVVEPHKPYSFGGTVTQP